MGSREATSKEIVFWSEPPTRNITGGAESSAALSRSFLSCLARVISFGDVRSMSL